MNKSIKRITSLLLCTLMASATVLPLVGCQDGSSGGTNDPNKTPLKYSIDALDGNFNPFFATSAPDNTIIGQTQIGMMTMDANGNPACGENQPTVVLDYKDTYLVGSTVTNNASEAEFTEYEFVIKNGIKFSDGYDLTIKDVLFNLYVYLDPMYTGSATMYSTSIVGLNKYRRQDPLALDDEDVNAGETVFEGEADDRINNLIDYLTDGTLNPGTDLTVMEADIDLAKKLFKEEVTRDWNASAGTLESYKDEYRFTEDWQIFFFNEGLIDLQYTYNQEHNYVLRKEDGKYFTSLDADEEGIVQAQHLIDMINGVGEDQDTTTALKALATAEGYTEGTDDFTKCMKKHRAINHVYNSHTSNTELVKVLLFWETGREVKDRIAKQLSSAYYEQLKQDNDGLLVPNIEGITTYKTTSWVNEKGNTVNLGEEHDVLKIKINKVDPKAIWNFSFAVAPMHYYSDQAHYNDAMDPTKDNEFGVEFRSQQFFSEVLQAPEKNKLPVGAGVYQATDREGKTLQLGEGSKFRTGGLVYFKRNENFHTVGDGLNNAHIKYLQYQEVSSDQLINFLSLGKVHVGSPSATIDNHNAVNAVSSLKAVKYKANGYGYVGINPTHVPDIEVRKAIMLSLNPNTILTGYYKGGYAEPIYRSMSTTSWVYDYIEVEQHENATWTTDPEVINDLVYSAGYRKNSAGIWAKDGQLLKITFTVAGGSKDHPAYSMFQNAANWLEEECGFITNVVTDVQALSKLTTGDLQVWAAAWQSSVDPDLYQVYHKDSTATSVKNWGYPTILQGSTEQFGTEQYYIEKLSEAIELARETTNREERAGYYETALDYIMDLCVEYPIYQRNDLIVFNKDLIDENTVRTTGVSWMSGVFDRIWEVNYVGASTTNTNNQTGLIIGIVAGVIVLAGAGVVVFTMLRKKAQANVIHNDEEYMDEEDLEEVSEEVSEEVTANEDETSNQE